MYATVKRRRLLETWSAAEVRWVTFGGLNSQVEQVRTEDSIKQ